MIQGESKIDLAFLYSQLIQISLQFDSIVINWVENSLFEKHIKSILKVNNTKLRENIEKYIELNLSISNSVSDYRGKLAYNTNDNYYLKYSKLFSNLINFFMKDKLIYDKSKNIGDLKKKMKNEYNPELPLLKQIFTFTINHCYELNKSININQFFNLEKDLNSYDVENICTTFLFPLIHQLIDEKQFHLENLNVYPWIKRTDNSSWFYEDIGIGGTINSTTEAFGKYLETYTKLNNHKDITYEQELIHRVLKLSSVLFKSMTNLKRYNENLKIQDIKIENTGTEILYDCLRVYDNIYCIKNQQLIYLVGVFVVKMIEHFREISPNLIYFIPKFIIEIPLNAFSILRSINSKVLYKSQDNIEMLEKLNLESNTFYSSLLSMASEFLYDENINNPEIIEILLQNINMIISFEETIDYISNNKQVLTKVLKGTSKYISHDIYSKITASIVITILKPICFGNNKNAKTVSMKQGIHECFTDDFEFFNKFMDSYTELLNKYLTKYYIIIEEIIEADNKLKNYGGDQNIISLYFKSLIEVMANLESVLSLYEAIIQVAPDILNMKSLTFTRLGVFLSNLSHRFLGKPYYKECQELSKKFNSNEYIQVQIKIFYILITFSNFFDNYVKNDNTSDIYEKMLISLSKSDINTDNLLNFVENIKSNELFKHDFKNEFFVVFDFIRRLNEKNDELKKLDVVRIN